MRSVRFLVLLLSLMCATVFAAPGVALACVEADSDAPAAIGEAADSIPAPDLPDELLCDVDSDEDDDSNDDDVLPAARGFLELAQPVARRSSPLGHQRSPSLQPASIFRPPRA